MKLRRLLDVEQSLEFCKEAFAQGAKIVRLSPWDGGFFSYGTKPKYRAHHHCGDDKKYWNKVRSIRPNWTSKYGYRVDTECHWWTEYAVIEFYGSRL